MVLVVEVVVMVLVVEVVVMVLIGNIAVVFRCLHCKQMLTEQHDRLFQCVPSR